MKDGAWLESDSEDVKKLKKGEKTVAIEALTSEEKELQGESGLQKVLTASTTTNGVVAREWID
ncbi:hypothetical protein PC123_g25738 [Phytophthora cactorum]|nr:hypothetical protein PC123_g25738 [Phytophthora cactorum]